MPPEEIDDAESWLNYNRFLGERVRNESHRGNE
jgi:hypothetical protein